MSEKVMVPCPKCGGTGEVEYSTRAIFGLNVQRLRKAKGWTQEELSERVKHTRAQIANIESGRSGTTLDGLLVFASAFGCDPGELLRATEPKESNEP